MSELSTNEMTTGGGHDPGLLNTPNVNSSNTATTPSSATSTTGGPQAPAAALVAADPAQFVPYLRQLVTVLIDANPNDFEKFLNDKSCLECVRKFITDPQTRNLIVQKYQSKGNLI